VLNLFKNIFSQSHDARSKLPPSLVRMAIERAVDGTDPRVRIISGYAKVLRESVIHAIEHVMGLVDGFPQPVAAGKNALTDNPAFAALFYSEARMEQIIERDAALREFRAANHLTTEPITALLVAQKTEKHGFGHAEVSGQVLSDVPRTTVGFDQHRLLEPAIDEQETRRLLMRRAFDHLLSIALSHITERKEERENLSSRKALLHSKLAIIQRGGGFAQHTGALDQTQLQTRLEEIDVQLSELGPAEDTLSDNLAIIAGVLAEAERHLWCEDKVLCLDQLYVLHDKPGPSAPPTVFTELHNSEGLQVTVLMVSIGSKL
jgi:hypothetical protein